jgi:hypothetical protein
MPPLTIFACSACPGDYEDPDRTAEEPDYLPEWEGDDAESAVEGPDQFASGARQPRGAALRYKTCGADKRASRFVDSRYGEFPS